MTCGLCQLGPFSLAQSHIAIAATVQSLVLLQAIFSDFRHLKIGQNLHVNTEAGPDIVHTTVACLPQSYVGVLMLMACYLTLLQPHNGCELLYM